LHPHTSMKKLDKLILQAFIGPFALTFFVSVFILLLQFMLGYFNDLVGKNLGFDVYAQLFFYFGMNMVPVALPLAVLLACLITFGNLGEHGELTAVKSAGISLLRTLLPICLFVVAISIGSFYFNDIIVPKANLKAYSLLYDITQKKATLNFKEGAFYNGIPNYSIKVNKKYIDGKALKGVMIYNHTTGYGNTDVTIADSGYMETFNNDMYLKFILFNGKNFSEVVGNDGRLGQEYVTSEFDKSTLIFNLESFKLARTDEDLFTGNRVMKDIAQLRYDSDSIHRLHQTAQRQASSNIKPYYTYVGKPLNVTVKDKQFSPKRRLSIIPFKDTRIASIAVNNARNLRSFVQASLEREDILIKEFRQYHIEIHSKFTQAVACLIMFLIGAPLGAIIKKGGLGVPVIVSIFFFILFYIITNLGMRWAKHDLMPVAVGMWLANFCLLPIGVNFLIQAKNDSRLFDGDSIKIAFMSIINNMLKKIGLHKTAEQTAHE
jgi:lipopolysaccharide export system permease protein